MTFVLVGGGPTGVELAGALGEIAHDTLKRDFRSIQLGRGPDHPGRGDGPGPAAVSARPLRVGAAPARAARRRGPDEDAGDRPRRGRRPGDRPDGTRGGDPGPDRAVGGGRPQRSRSRGRSPRRPGAATDRAGRVARRARPDDPRPSRDLRGRRCGRRAVEAGQADARASPRARSRAARTRRRSSAGGSSAGRTSRSATATTATSRSSAGCRASPTSAGSARSGGRAASRPGRCGSASTSST